MRYFDESEFLRCSPPCSMSQMDPVLLSRLDELREIVGFPIVLNSAFRSADYDVSRGRSGKGMHTYGQAVDVRCSSSAQRGAIVAAALSLGFNGIGIASTFIHLDIRKDLSIWLY